MIKLEKVNKYFNKNKKSEIHVINNTSLELPDAGLVALIGPSGCGKTTLLNTIGGLDKVRSGNIYINNRKITKRSVKYIDRIRNLNIGYIFQNYYLIDNKTVFENVALSLKMVGIKDKTEIKKRVNYVLDILKIYRYRNRPAAMLSGGERQRVGIARAIVKDPSIIIADEPTGNLDSNNTIEIMNIIKSISKKRLVLLVTHENDIAKFYADRIIEIEDGVIQKDYANAHNNNLDYRIDNKIYLKDFQYKHDFSNEDNEISIYNNSKNDVKLTIIVKNNNIYIKGSKNDKIEVIDTDSNIELINDHYKQIDKSIYEKYEFDFTSIISQNEKLKYSSIFNPITLIINGFKKLIDYSFIKKMLLLGFLASGSFIMYALSNIGGIIKIEDKDFINKNHAYYDVTLPTINVNNYLKYENIKSVDYLLPGSSNISFMISFPYYYQTTMAKTTISGSLTSLDKIGSEDLIMGKMPTNNYEVVVDKMVINNIINSQDKIAAQVGEVEVENFLNKEIQLKNLSTFKIVGMVEKQDPSIYANESFFIDMIYNSMKEEDRYSDITYSYEKSIYIDNQNDSSNESVLKNYKLDEINLKKGRLPENDYEIIINSSKEMLYEINQKIDMKVNGTKLTVVGYYESDNNYFYTNPNTIKYDLISKSKNITVMPKDNARVVNDFNKENLIIKSSYEVAKADYQTSRKNSVNAALVVCGIMLAISFVEIYLMVRASFLSRIKEIGTYRAIGVKRSDIYKMFLGEIIAITTTACVPGVLFVAYCISSLTSINYFANNFLVNGLTIGCSILVIYLFNIIVGLLPVMKVISQTPAQILSRKDLE